MNWHESMEIEWTPEAFDIFLHGANAKILHVCRPCGSDQVWANIHVDSEPTEYLTDFESVCADWSDPVAVLVAVRQIATTHGLFPEET